MINHWRPWCGNALECTVSAGLASAGLAQCAVHDDVRVLTTSRSMMFCFSLVDGDRAPVTLLLTSRWSSIGVDKFKLSVFTTGTRGDAFGQAVLAAVRAYVVSVDGV